MNAITTKKRLLNDLVLVAVLVILALAAWGVIRFLQNDGAYAVVVINGVDTASYPLDTDAEIIIESDDGHYNTLAIVNGRASVIAADCPDKLCVKQRPANKTGQTITCLPHRVVIRIDGIDSNVDVVP